MSQGDPLLKQELPGIKVAVRAFAWRKGLAVTAGVGLVFGLTAIGFFNENSTLILGGLTARGWQLVVIGVMLILAGLMIAVWRCPVCSFFLGLAGEPRHCPRCQTQLKK
jgi:hypothetical protein